MHTYRHHKLKTSASLPAQYKTKNGHISDRPELEILMLTEIFLLKHGFWIGVVDKKKKIELEMIAWDESLRFSFTW